ncbi:unnamed protein product [Durusdinium trenchii]|uniref:6-phosphofructo-2-kinase domain-containing protein n=1 Tax=Durusdinium trenchii TaxID=1381693 RepID=A0ABP0KNK3_9DINO
MVLDGCLAGTSLGGLLGLLLKGKPENEAASPGTVASANPSPAQSRRGTKQLPEKLQNRSSLHPFKMHVESMTAKTVEVKSDTPLDAAPALPARAQTAPLDAAAEQAAEAVLEAAVSAQPRSFHRRVSGKFTMNENKVVEQKVVLAMVGLPARGKSYISKAIVRYLNFCGCPTRLFNAGNLRRESGKSGVKANFFDNSNADAKRMRDEMAMECLDQVLDFLEACGRATAVGILDATNTTLERRQKVKEKVRGRPGVRLIFLESLCDDEEILESNYELKLNNDDYKGMNAENALKDFKHRVQQYAEVYEPVQDDECDSRCGYIKLINAGEKLICYRCRSKDDEYGVVRYIFGLMGSINLGKRCIMIAMVGETEHDRQGLLGGDSELTEAGKQHAAAIAGLVAECERQAKKPVLVMCGTLARHLQTVEALKGVNGCSSNDCRTVLKLARLNELCAGLLDSLSYKDETGRSGKNEHWTS